MSDPRTPTPATVGQYKEWYESRSLWWRVWNRIRWHLGGRQRFERHFFTDAERAAIAKAQWETHRSLGPLSRRRSCVRAQLRHLASMPCIREAAAVEEALLDARPAPAGFSVDGWVGHLAQTENPNEEEA